MLCRSLEPSAGGHLPSWQGGKLRPGKEEEQDTPASVRILDTLGLDPGTLRLSTSPTLWLQAMVLVVPQPEPFTLVTSTWPRARRGMVTDAQEKCDSG